MDWKRIILTIILIILSLLIFFDFTDITTLLLVSIIILGLLWSIRLIEYEILYTVPYINTTANVNNNYLMKNKFLYRCLCYTAIKHRYNFPVFPGMNLDIIYPNIVLSGLFTYIQSADKIYPSFIVRENIHFTVIQPDKPLRLENKIATIYLYQILTEANFLALIEGVTYPNRSIISNGFDFIQNDNTTNHNLISMLFDFLKVEDFIVITFDDGEPNIISSRTVAQLLAWSIENYELKTISMHMALNFIYIHIYNGLKYNENDLIDNYN